MRQVEVVLLMLQHIPDADHDLSQVVAFIFCLTYHVAFREILLEHRQVLLIVKPCLLILEVLRVRLVPVQLLDLLHDPLKPLLHVLAFLLVLQELEVQLEVVHHSKQRTEIHHPNVLHLVQHVQILHLLQ